MMLNMLKDKRVWIGLIIALLFVVGIISAIQSINKSKETNGSEESGVSQDVSDDVDEDEPYDGDGMEVVEEGKTQETTMEVPKSWEDSKTDDTQSNSTDDKNDANSGDASDMETLKDDTSWGSIF